MPSASRRHKRPARAALLSPEWRAYSKAIRERDGNRCRQCAASGPRLEVHHLDPVADGGPEFAHPSRLVTLCKRCHARAHARRPKAADEWDRAVNALRSG